MPKVRGRLRSRRRSVLKPEARPPEPVEAKKPEPAPAQKPEPTPVKKQEPVEAKKPEPAPAKKPEAQPAPTPAAEKKPAESSVGTVRVTPPPGLAAAAGGLSPMRLARKDPNRGKPQAMPGMAGSVQAAMRAAGTPAGKPTPAAGSEAKRPEAPAAPARTATPAGTAIPRTPSGKPASSSGATSGTAKGGSAASGAQTALFARQNQNQDQGDSDDSDVTRKIPSADPRATDRQRARPRDAVEDAILRNDPVPRHLKEAAEGGEAARKALKEADSTEFIEQSERPKSRLGIVVGLLAAVALGGGIWFYTQHGDTPSGATPGETTATPTGPAAGTNPATGNTAPTPGPETAPPVPVAEPLNNGTGTGTTAGKEVVAPTPANPEPAKPVAANPEPTKPVAANPEPAKPVVAKPEAAKPEPAKPVVAKPEPAKPEPAKPVAATPVVTPPAGTAPGTLAAKPTLDEVRKKIGEDIPKGFDDQMELAQRLVERYKYDSAQALYEYMLTYASSVPAIHNGLGTCAFEKNRGDEAIQHYRNALERRPSYSAAVFGLAKTYHRLKNDKEQALVYYKKYLELSPKGSAAAIARDAIAKLEGTAPAAPPAAPPPRTPRPPPSPRPSSPAGGPSSPGKL